jgi:glucosamine--fructose-6-phosphate aminotransferase (isomerizing)
MNNPQGDVPNTMLAQISSLPDMIREVWPTFDRDAREVLDHSLCLAARRLFLTGCGDSHHATLASELAFESLAGLPTEPMTALQFSRYAVDFLPQGGLGANLVIGISVSGEVSRTLDGMQRARKAGATVIALTATPGSRIALAGDRFLPMVTPPFDFAPGVRSYVATVLMLYATAVRLGEVRGKLTSAQATDTRQEIASLADAIERTIELCDEPARKLAADWKDADEFAFTGGGPNFGTALFSAAKVLEASGDSAVGQDTEEWAHLQYFARAVSTPTFIITAGERDISRAHEVAVAAKTIGRRVVGIVPEDLSGLGDLTGLTLRFASVREVFSPFVACVPGMLFAAYRAEVLGEPFFRAFGGGRDVSGGGGISRIRTSQIVEQSDSHIGDQSGCATT